MRKNLLPLLLMIATFSYGQGQNTDAAAKCFQDKDYRCAAELYSKIADKEKIARKRAEYLNQAGISYKAMGKNAEAQKSFEAAIKFSPTYAQAYENLALLHRARSGADSGLEILNRGLQYNPDNADLLLARARYYQYQKKNDLAEKDFRMAIDLMPEKNLYKIAYAGYKKDMGKYAEALTDFNLMLSDKPESILYASRADLFLAQKKYKEALADVDKALTLDPKSAYGQFVKAKILFQQKKTAEGCALLDKAIKNGLDPLVAAELADKCAAAPKS